MKVTKCAENYGEYNESIYRKKLNLLAYGYVEPSYGLHGHTSTVLKVDQPLNNWENIKNRRLDIFRIYR